MRSEDVNKVLKWFKDEVALLETLAQNDPKMMAQVEQLQNRVEALLGDDLSD